MNYEERYSLTLTLLSPVHIGTGEDFEPTNYVIDKNSEGKDRLYEFDEVSFYKALPADQQREFDRIVSDGSSKARFELYRLITNNKKIAVKVSHRNIQVLPHVAKEYYDKIGKVVQKEGGGKNVFNDFTIAKTSVDLNSYIPYIPGSSIKGSISTAFQELLFKKFGDYKKVESLMLKPTDENLFRHLRIADALPIRQGTFIGYAKNIKRGKETQTPLETRLEGISSGCVFKTDIAINNFALDKKLSFDEIARSCNDHYLPVFQSIFDTTTDEFAKMELQDDFIEKYEKFEPQKGQFLLRIGKHSGARAVTVDGIRTIKIMQGKGRDPKYLDHETTLWLRGGGDKGLLPFGWILCEYTKVK